MGTVRNRVLQGGDEPDSTLRPCFVEELEASARCGIFCGPVETEDIVSCMEGSGKGVISVGIVPTVDASLGTMMIQNFVDGSGHGGAAGSSPYSLMRMFLKLSPPTFEGTPHGNHYMEAESWVRRMEMIFRILECDERHKVLLATFMLRGMADLWWEFAENRRVEGSSRSWDWDSFKTAFKDTFVPRHVRHNLMMEFMRLEQGGMTVSEYHAKFLELCRFYPTKWEDKAMASKFLMGLRPWIRSRIFLVEESFSDVLDRAMNVESVCGEGYLEEEEEEYDRGVGNTEKKRKGKAEVVPRGACFQCGQMGHRARNCPTKNDG